MEVSHHPHCDWQLNVKVDGKTINSEIVSANTAKEGWLSKEIDLSEFAGKTIELKLENFPNSWHGEHGFWSSVKIISN